jgi:hypothetical protein
MENETAQNPPPETRPRPLPPDGETRSLSDTLAAAGAAGVGFTAGKLAVEGTVAKVKDALAPKDEGPKVILPSDPKD